MSWVLSLARSGGTAGSHGGHETRRHRVRGPFPMGACLLLAGTLALAGCGSSSNSTVTINQQQQQPPEPELTPEPETETEPQTGDGDGVSDGQTSTQQPTQPPSNQPPPQTGGGSGEGEGDGSGGSGSGDQGAGGQGAGGGTPPTDTTTTEDGDGDTDSGDTTTTDGGGQTSTQQPPQPPSNQQPRGGGSGGGQGGGGSQTSNSSNSSNSSSSLGISPNDLKNLISNYSPNINLNLPTGFSIESSPTSKDSDTVYDRQFDIVKSGNKLSYEVKSLPKCLAASRPDGFCLGTPLHDKDWSGRLYKDGKSLGVIYSNLPKKYPLNTWAIFFSPGGGGQHEKLVLDSASGKLSWGIGSTSKSPLSALNIPGSTSDGFGGISVSQGNHPGTFYSVPGTFNCPSECSLDAVGGEEFYFVGGGPFSFTPNDGATATIPDNYKEIPPHVHFGYWLKAPENDGESWSIETFSLANFYGEPETDYNLGKGLSALQGSASYSGPATGIYTIPDHPMGGSTGQFRARVTLRANWGQPAGNPFTLEDSWTITGSVDGFDSLTSPQHSGFMRDWSLDLGKASMATQRDGDGGASTNNIRLNQGFRDGATTGSGPDSQTGSWTGRFWGKDSTAPGNRKNEPMAVTGEFTGHFGDKLRVEGKPHALGSVVGSFVAGKE